VRVRGDSAEKVDDSSVSFTSLCSLSLTSVTSSGSAARRTLGVSADAEGGLWCSPDESDEASLRQRLHFLVREDIGGEDPNRRHCHIARDLVIGEEMDSVS
jgi:hypothetical protein